MNIVKYKSIFLAISGILMIASVIFVAAFGLRPGIDFAGGTLWQIRASGADSKILADYFENNLNIKNAVIYPEAGTQSFLVKLAVISETEHQNYLSGLKEKFEAVEELRYESIGPTIGRELKNKAIIAVILVLLGISLYVAYAFRKVSYPIKSWKYGIITLLTLFHDVVISTGFLAYLGWRYGIELDTKFIVALLVIVGFSVHDTIVVFDRIRENLVVSANRTDLQSIINSSVNQTMARSINTSLTLVLVLLTLFLLGPISLKYFVLLVMVGTIVGTYSSIFIASPSLLVVGKKKG